MANSIVDELGRIPMSPYLAATLTRAASYATTQGHLQVSIEHLLLALSEDPEATVVLKASGVDLARLAADVSSYLGRVEERGEPGAMPASLSLELKRILEAAAAAASHGRRREINGAIVLAAIVGEGKSAAAQMLRAQGLTFEEAIRALQKSQAEALPAKPQPASTEDILASARERVQTRTQPPPATNVSTGPPPAPLEAGPPPEPSPPQQQVPTAPPPPPSGPARAEPASPATSERVAASLQRDYVHPPQMEPGQRSAPPAPDQPRWAPPVSPSPQPAGGVARPHRAPPPSLSTLPPPPVPPGGYPPPVQGGSPPRAPPSYLPPADAFGAPQRPANAARPAPPWDSAQARPQIRPPSPTGSPPQASAAGPRRVAGSGHVQAGQLIENIPRSMRVAVPVIVEARIARANVRAIAEGLQGAGTPTRHEILVSRAMSVRLRAPDGGFYIETASPETQWIDNVLGVMSDDFASWRWSVTPKGRGKRRLQLLVSARTAGTDGLIADTALPDQVIEVKVGINYGLTMKKWGGWMMAAVVGGLFARFGEDVYAFSRMVIEIFNGG